MKLAYKITLGVFGLLGLGILYLGFILSNTDDCPTSPMLVSGSEKMKAVVYRCYGSPEVLEYTDIGKPSPEDNQLLVKVHSASVNPLDWHYMRGTPYVMRFMSGLGAPETASLGVDFSGTVVAVGKDVTKFKPGDEVFGGATGAYAEYLTISEDSAVVLKPANVSFQHSSSVAIAGVTALQALRDLGEVKPGDKVLINGASGGVGTFAVQIAKTFGAEVTGVCSTRNLALVRSIGADHVIDYKNQDYTQSGEQYDLIIDMVGNHSLLSNKKVLSAEGKMIIVGAPKGDWIAPFIGPIAAMVLSSIYDQKFELIMASLRKDDMQTLGELMKGGKLTPVLDQSFSLSETDDAIRYSEKGRARGKIIIDVI